jgi:hypothetical protein
VEFVVDKAALGQVFSEYFGFPCQSSFHQFFHHHNHPGLTQEAYGWPQCQVDRIGLQLYQLKQFLCKLSNNMETSNAAEIRTVFLSNISRLRYRYTSLGLDV